MKKLLSVMLALCLIFACFPASADMPQVDPTGLWTIRGQKVDGEWFWVGLNINFTITINADGTAVMDGTLNDRAARQNCTWTLTDNILTLMPEGALAYYFGLIDGVAMTLSGATTPDMIFEHVLPMPEGFSPVGYWTGVQMRTMAKTYDIRDRSEEYQLTLREDGTGIFAFTGKDGFENPVTWKMTDDGFRITFLNGTFTNFVYENDAVTAVEDELEIVFVFHPDIGDELLIGTWNTEHFLESYTGMTMTVSEMGMGYVVQLNEDGTGTMYYDMEDELFPKCTFNWEKDEATVIAHSSEGEELHFTYKDDYLYWTDEPLQPCMVREEVTGLPEM